MVASRGASAQSLTTMVRFHGPDGAAAIWKPVADGQGNLYGTTENGGANVSDQFGNGMGTVYAFTPSTRAFQVLHSFAGGSDGPVPTDGALPTAGLTYDKNSGMLYGTTGYGGNTVDCQVLQGCGTIFSLNPATGAYATLYAFSGGADQGFPLGPLTLGSDGILYGTTGGAGAVSCGPHGCTTTCAQLQQNTCGTAFKYDPSTGSFTTIHTFVFSDGAEPTGPLVFGKAGKLFGVAQAGGHVDQPDNPGGLGVVFRLDPVTGAVTVLYKFTDVATPNALAVDTDNNLYVTAVTGGANGTGAIIKLVPNVGGPYTVSTLFSFDPSGSNLSGQSPLGAVAFDSSRNVLYGTTYAGGADGHGTLYQLDPSSGAFSLLHSFTGGADGQSPQSGVLINLGQLDGGASGSLPSQHSPECDNYGCGSLFKYPRF